MAFKSEAERRAAFARMHAQGGKGAPRQRKPKALAMTAPLLPLHQVMAQVQQYEGRPVPRHLVRQLERHGSAVLKKGGYTAGLEPLRLPEATLARSQAGAVLRGASTLPPLDRKTPVLGVQRRPGVQRRQEQVRRSQWRRVATLATLAAGAGAVPAGYFFLRMPAGRALASRAIRNFHPLRPLQWGAQDAKTLPGNSVEQRIRDFSAGLTRASHKRIDALFDRLVGNGEVPGMIDRLDARFRRGLYALARRAKIPASTRYEIRLPEVKRSRQLWNDLLKMGEAEGLQRTPTMRQTKTGLKPLVQGGGIPVYRIGHYQLKRVSPAVIRRRKVR